MASDNDSILDHSHQPMSTSRGKTNLGTKPGGASQVHQQGGNGDYGGNCCGGGRKGVAHGRNQGNYASGLGQNKGRKY